MLRAISPESAAVTRVSNTPVITVSPGFTCTQIRYDRAPRNA
jgi:hypothetical protein